MTDDKLTSALVAAQHAGAGTVDPAPYAEIDREAAYRIQLGVRSALGAKVGMLKTAIQSDGVGVVAPIYAANVGRAPGFGMPARGAIGLEVEVGLVLTGLPSDPALDNAAVAAAIDHYFLGVEICGTRYADRKAAGPMGSLADNMSGLGYVIGPARHLGDAIDGLQVRLEFAGLEIHAAPSKHAFGAVLSSLIAYARAQRPEYPLMAGTIVTTGSMCGLVAARGPGHVVAALGGDTMEFDLV